MSKLDELRAEWLSAYAAANVAITTFANSASVAGRDNNYNSACDAIDICEAANSAYVNELKNEK